MEQLGQTDVDRKQRQVFIISQDSFYKNLNEEEKESAKKGQYNFDHPGKFSLCTTDHSLNNAVFCVRVYYSSFPLQCNVFVYYSSVPLQCYVWGSLSIDYVISELRSKGTILHLEITRK